MSVIELNNIHKKLNQVSILNGINFTLSQGEVIGLFGHNGAGKTTTIKIILGLIKPCSGSVKVFGENPNDINSSHFRYRLGFLPENVSFYPQLTGIEVLNFFAKLKKISLSHCPTILKRVGLYKARSQKIKTYSKGMKQRLGLAQALLTDPCLLLLDEPTVGLDPIATQEFYQIVDDLRTKGCSIILCSHVLPGVEKHIDKAAIMSKGKLKAYGSLEQLREQTKLETQIFFSGCFNIEELSQHIAYSINVTRDGQLSVTVPIEHKLNLISQLMKQPGIQDINTQAPNLEQLYRHIIENDQQTIQLKQEAVYASHLHNSSKGVQRRHS